MVTPTEGTIRYGTKDGLASSATNFNWHWGTNFDTLGVIQWSRLENAEKLVTPPKEFPKDTVACTGAIGDAFRGFLSPTPVTQTAAPNTYSPFATNFTSTVQGNYRVQYLYRYSELVAAGLCFPATIDAFSFYCLDQETLNNVGPPVFPTTITGEVRDFYRRIGNGGTDHRLNICRSHWHGVGAGAPAGVDVGFENSDLMTLSLIHI